MAGSELRDVVEYHRAVHAELSAILDAARRGVKTDATILYSTTYPCHLCAKEIVAAGVSRVVYIEPYPKSLANAMYSDSISEDEDAQRAIPFLSLVGISPRRFHEFFEEGRSLESTVSTTDQLPFTEPDWAFDRIKEREDDFVASLPD
jgi:deoxycytidylate deaminase